MNRLVYVCHPYGEDPAFNARVVRGLCSVIQTGGDIPIFPPFAFPWLVDSDPQDRAAGMEAGLHLLALCREVLVYRHDGHVSAGMKNEIARARELRIPIKWMDEESEAEPVSGPVTR